MKKTLLILFALVVVLALVVHPGCKSQRNDITGTWFFTLTFPGETFTETYTFVGTRQSGEVYWEGEALGTYSVIGDNVSFTLDYIDVDGDYTVEVYDGSFVGDDEMIGSVTVTIEGYGSASGSWIAER
ncbi:MAG: hypothetical protein GTO45_16685 [Candidatus Aminicenantes bacterium]|nr:hypothetical protein [Candidatus Aminicenantes bacterium]NIM80379.1 hypothetical protein [Candidatus Aminicenantes bacterium]NIN19765.1 hypothetical protein [Candidatus Aminicenantes bacterium]NIN43647.1 hypothetical protein [Candidatus Aminicenantes bacterium]NIN86392.1 hypothetical protein [Candidatus Aminicenantes bacterium]